jgi:hypothetical protein
MTGISAIALSDSPLALKKSRPDPAAQLLDQLAANGMSGSDTQKIKEEQAKLKDTLDSLHAARKTLKQQLKEAAEQRIAFIKAEIDALKQMGAMGDPKTAAREAAQLAKQLASAVRDYAAGAEGIRAEDAANGDPPPVSALVAEDGQFKSEVDGIVLDLKIILAVSKFRAQDFWSDRGAVAAFSDVTDALAKLQASESFGSTILNIQA